MDQNLWWNLGAEAREQYNVVPAQALMELFLAEEGGRSKGRVSCGWLRNLMYHQKDGWNPINKPSTGAGFRNLYKFKCWEHIGLDGIWWYKT